MSLSISACGLAIATLWILTLVTPTSQATKVRNSFIAELGQEADFSWQPNAWPAGFLRDRGGATPEFTAFADTILAGGPTVQQDPWSAALRIAEKLVSMPRIDVALQTDSLSSYKAIVAQGRGYCADYTKVFASLAIAAGIPVRDWGMGLNAFGAGHAFNEIFDARRNKWLLIDSYQSLYFVDPASGEPLSTTEVHDRLLGFDATNGIAVRPIVPARFAFTSEDRALAYYRAMMPQLFLVWGNNVFDRERSRPIRLAGKVSRYVEQAVALVTREYPAIRIYPTGVNVREYEELEHAARVFLLASFCFFVAFVLFAIQLVGALRGTMARPRPAAAE